jgi:hypothetical protein
MTFPGIVAHIEDFIRLVDHRKNAAARIVEKSMCW